jgi:hypothetical protein
VQQRIAGDLALSAHDDQRLLDLELHSVRPAQHHDATPLSRRHTVPGIGKMGSVVLLYAIHTMDRLPRGQDFASSCRRVQCAQAAAGNRYGTSGTKIGQA